VLKWCALVPAAVFAVLLVLLLVDAVLRQFTDSSLACSARLQASAEAVVGCDARSSETVTIYIPGIMARAHETSRPVLDTWLQLGDVQFIDYLGDRFKPEILSRELGRVILADADSYQRVNIYAESLGCSMATDALRSVKAQLEPGVRDKIRLVLGDCPAGVETIHSANAIVTVFYPGPIYNNIANGLFGLFRFTGIFSVIDNGCPNLDQWSWSAICSPAEKIAPYLDVGTVQRAQVEMNSGFALSPYTDQVRYLREGIPDADGLAGLDVRYLMNRPEADLVVAQPAAAQKWESALKTAGAKFSLIEFDAPSNHCDYLAWPKEWNAFFATVFL
jgi:hypothetical protein